MTTHKIEDCINSDQHVETSKQHRAVKPVIVSRRRLLRAGAASIPVILTMAARTPLYAETGQWSGASGLNYDGRGIAARFWNYNDGGIVHSDTNGIIFDPASDRLVYKQQSYTNNFYVKITTNDTTPKEAIFKVSVIAYMNMFQHKNGYWYMRNANVVLDPTDEAKKSLDVWMSTTIGHEGGDSVTTPSITWNTPVLTISPALDNKRDTEGNVFKYSLKTNGGDNLYITVTSPSIGTEAGYTATWTDSVGGAATAPSTIAFGTGGYLIPMPVQPADF